MSVSFHAAVAAALVAHAAGAEAFHPVAETLAGETLDLEQPTPAAEDEEPSEPPTVDPADLPMAPSAPSAPASRRSSGRPLAPPAPSGSAPAAPTAPPLPYGAVGVRYASDLATTFTRSFPQAASSDPAWGGAPFGSAGVATVCFVLDEVGHLMSTAVLGSPSAALRRGIERTLVLLEPRAFTASAAITRLRISARVARDDVHDGLHGEVFALSGGSFTGDVGSAFFALPGGSHAARRVDVEVRLLP